MSQPDVGAARQSAESAAFGYCCRETTLAHGDASGNTHDACPGYTGTIADFSDAGLIDIELQPALSEGGWIRNGEYFTVLSFALSAYKRVTNGYNSGLSGQYYSSASIYMERLNP